ncbi:MAG: 23S rRNA (pseudouridine(1915)-N(3))-methyltransferase RlmH [Bacteroidota bacterium]|nr:23S rRNA (pseudouridine(1915)-N(3))-methyltransferase RlmH [Bacteroidota bacterium]
MKLRFWSVGKTHEPYVMPGIEMFTKRISHYFSVEWKLVSSPKNAANLSKEDLKIAEGESVLNLLKQDDVLVVLDEKGKEFSSEQLAKIIQQKANSSTKNLIFLIGGAYGVDEEIIKRANFTWSLSQLVFPHQLVRLILAEQIYRACTILRNEKYHHS